MSSNIQCTEEPNDPTLCDRVEHYTTTTTDATQTVIGSLEVNTNTSVAVSLDVMCRRVDGGADGEVYYSQAFAAFSDVGGTLVQQGVTTIVPYCNTALLVTPIELEINGKSIELKVTGALTNTFNWQMFCKYFVVS